MQYWIVKSEPNDYSWQDIIRDKKTNWDGVRNYQARNNLRDMKLGDKVFFYESLSTKAIMGLMKVSKTYMPDPTDVNGKFGMVEMEFFKQIKNSVTLQKLKEHKLLREISLVKQSRLSVCPITKDEFDLIIELSR